VSLSFRGPPGRPVDDPAPSLTITHAKKGLDAMLVLSRKVGERILIGDQIAITVVRLGQGAVRIGVDAPGQMTVVREELVQRAADHPASEVILS
jgi:carbon storage regulator